jgi:hypothetical protein
MAKRRTKLLILLLAPAALCALLAFFRKDKLKDDAAAARQNLADARRDIEEIRRWRSSPGRAAPLASMETPRLNARLREAATAAGLTDAPGSEANQPQRLGGTDYSEMTVYLRPEPLTMHQLTTFLVTLARIEPSARVKTIELSAPESQGVTVPAGRGQNGEDVWIADITVAYLTYTPPQK